MEILALCKKENGATGITATPAVLEQAHLPANPGDGASISLAALGSVSGVNQLAAGPVMSIPGRWSHRDLWPERRW